MCSCCRCWKAPNTKDAYRLSWASLFITVGAMFVGIKFFRDTGSSLCLVFALENMVDFISSVVVLWRFFAPKTVDDAIERKLRQREERASVAISFIMIILGLGIAIAAIEDFTRGEEDGLEKKAVILISFLSIAFFGTLAILKFRYAFQLDSPSLYKDGICSMIGTVLAVALFVNTIIVAQQPSAWWIDPTVALLAGLFAMYLGVSALGKYRKDGVEIYSMSWWFTSKDAREEDAENNGSTDVELPPATAEDSEVV